METAQHALHLILRDVSCVHTITSLSKKINMSRVGTWKILKKLETQRLIILKPLSTGETSTTLIYLNFENPLTIKNLELILIADSQHHERWIDSFLPLKKDVLFAILFGSILHSPKEARDIDLILVAQPKKLQHIPSTLFTIQKTQPKKIHATTLSSKEFKEEVSKENTAILDAIKKGIVLFGQGTFISYLQERKK